MSEVEGGLDIVCLGEPMYEFTRREVDGVGEVYVPGVGGDTSNCAIAAARQGARVGYVTALGEDRFGDAMVEAWTREGVDSSAVVRDGQAHTGIYFIDPHPTGRDFTYFRAGSAASRITVEQMPRDYLAQARILHVSAISQAISESARAAVGRAIDIVAASGGRISYDTNLRLALWPLDQARDVIDSTLRDAHIALPSVDEARELTGLASEDDILDLYLSWGPSIVALKCGETGVAVATSERRERLSGHQVVSVDASGAGDCFDGAFLARLSAGDGPFSAARYANAAAALSTTGLGAVTPIPTVDQVRTFLSEVGS